MNAIPPAIYDLAVIGGGINGAGIARDAAGRGLSVLLVEKDDLASHTSSWSTKLIHGGLRYLEHYEFRLVAEALAEREVLLRARAAHHRAAAVRAAARAASAAGVDDPRRPVPLRSPRRPDDAAAVVRRATSTRASGAQGSSPASAKASSTRTRASTMRDWSSLNAIDARANGRRRPRADARSRRARATNGLWRATLVDGAGRREDVRARALVNAAGPWVKDVLDQRQRRTRCAQACATSRAATSSCRACTPSAHAYILQNADNRIVFVIPYRAELFADRHDRRPGRRLRGRRTFRRRDRLPAARSPTPISRVPLARDGHRVDLQRRAPALRRRLGRPVGGHARLRAEARRADATAQRAAAVGLRRQDHDLPQARRARARSSCAPFFPAMKRGVDWTDRQPLPGGDLPTGGLAAYERALAARYPGTPAEPARARWRTAMARARPRILGDARGAGRSGRGFRRTRCTPPRSTIWSRRNGRSTADDVLWRRTKCGLPFARRASATRSPLTCASVALAGAGRLGAAMRPLVAMPARGARGDARRADRHRRHAVDRTAGSPRTPTRRWSGCAPRACS